MQERKASKSPGRYWGFRTDSDHRDDLILPELDEGRLHQGWGYDDSLNMAVIADTAVRSEAQVEAWKRVHRMADEMSVGDVILVKNIPEYGFFRVVKVVGPYEYLGSTPTDDHRHVLRVETLIDRVSVDADCVSAALKRTFRCQHPIWHISHREDIDRVLREAQDSPNSPAKASTVVAKAQDVLAQAASGLFEKLTHRVSAADLEEPIAKALEGAYPEWDVDLTGGRGERGADIRITRTDALGLTMTIVVQVKDHREVLGDERALEQIHQAAQEQGVVAGIVMTTAPRQGNSSRVADAMKKLERDLGITVRVVFKEELAELLLRYLPLALSED